MCYHPTNHLLETSDLDNNNKYNLCVSKILIINCLFQLLCKFHVILRVFPRIFEA